MLPFQIARITDDFTSTYHRRVNRSTGLEHKAELHRYCCVGWTCLTWPGKSPNPLGIEPWDFLGMGFGIWSFQLAISFGPRYHTSLNLVFFN
jgi:hypothetical protein